MQFWKWISTCISEIAAHRAKIISTISNPWDRKRVCATSGTFANSQVSCPNMDVFKSVRISETKLNFDLYMCNFANNLYASFSLLYQNWHADLECVWKFCFLVTWCYSAQHLGCYSKRRLELLSVSRFTTELCTSEASLLLLFGAHIYVLISTADDDANITLRFFSFVCWGVKWEGFPHYPSSITVKDNN